MNKELLFSITKKDFKIEWYSGKGAGGQHRNKHQNCCRLTHIESGITKTGQSSRSRETNLKEALLSISKDQNFKKWIRKEVAKREGEVEPLESVVDKLMQPSNIKVESFQDRKWKETSE